MARPTGQGGIDYPDGGFPTGLDVYPVLNDLAEEAARLKSPVNFDRRGTVFLIDDFEHGIGSWLPLMSETTNRSLCSGQRARTGGYSLKIVPTSSGSYNHILSRQVAYPQPSKIGVEISFTVVAATDYIQFKLLAYDGTTLHTIGIEVDYSNDQVEYLDSNGDWQVLDTDVDLSDGNTLFHVLKFVVDLENDEYHRVLLDANKWEDLSYAVQTAANGAAPYLEFRLRVYASDNSQPAHYFDGLIFTQNEP